MRFLITALAFLLRPVVRAVIAADYEERRLSVLVSVEPEALRPGAPPGAFGYCKRVECHTVLVPRRSCAPPDLSFRVKMNGAAMPGSPAPTRQPEPAPAAPPQPPVVPPEVLAAMRAAGRR